MDYSETLRVTQAGRTVEERGLGQDSLCARCRNGMLTRRRASLNVVVFCSEIRKVMPSDIVECSAFSEQKSMTLEEMNDIAVEIDKREGINERSYK